MRRMVGWVAALLLGATGLVACYDPATDGYHVVFQEDFDGTALNTNVWADNMPWFSDPAPGRVTVSDGTLKLVDKQTDPPGCCGTEVLTLSQRNNGAPDGTYHYPYALTWQDGFFEARIRYSASDYMWPAFWMFGEPAAQLYPQSACPNTQDEWDIMENAAGAPLDVWNSNIHTSTNNSCGVTDTGPGSRSFDTDQDLSQWHTYGARRRDNQLCYYLDGAETGCVTQPASWNDPMFIVLTAAYHCFGNCDEPQPAEVTVEVDWVKVWQR